jgi:hypothetical protein
MKPDLTPARARESATADPDVLDALDWLEDFDPGDDKGGAIGPTDASDLFGRDVVVAAFVAGRESVGAGKDGVDRLLDDPGVREALAKAQAAREGAVWDDLTQGEREGFRTVAGQRIDAGRAARLADRSLLGEASTLFRQYEAHHRARVGSAHADDRLRKAETNAAIADRIERRLLGSTVNEITTRLAGEAGLRPLAPGETYRIDDDDGAFIVGPGGERRPAR